MPKSRTKGDIVADLIESLQKDVQALKLSEHLTLSVQAFKFNHRKIG